MESQSTHAAGSLSTTHVLSRPDYLSARSDGLYITLSKFHSGVDFAVFVDEIFASNLYFADLDYSLFLTLLYDDKGWQTLKDKIPDVKIASGLASFSQQRRMLYKAVKVLERGNQAEYVFEPVQLEVTVVAPVYGEADENGVIPILRHASSTILQAASLNIDEFVASLWSKGIKYGIQHAEARQCIAHQTIGRKIAAIGLPPVEGKDADILEVCPDLHRDNSPKTLLNGKTDMRAFKNRFPHIAKGARLLKKIPRVMGKPGYKVTGELVEPAMPKDINLLALASTGTNAIMEADGDYLVAEMDGFLNIDPVTNTISITEKIETKAGVSMKTTGDLMLNVEEFVEHGEVQEGRVVKGRNMTFKDNVFGNLLSSSGNITVDGNLTGGTADAANGNVILSRASRASIHALNGEVTVKNCENCTIIAKKIRIEHGVNCELIADEIDAQKIEGCFLAGKLIKIETCNESKSRESLITMIIPDLTAFNQNIEKINRKLLVTQDEIKTKKSEIDQLKTDPDFSKFLILYDKIKIGEIKLTTDQTDNWQKLVTQHGRLWNQTENLNKQIVVLERTYLEIEEEITKINQNRDTAAVGISCEIAEVTGLTRGQTMTSVNGLQSLSTLSPNDVKANLQQGDQRKTKIFSADDGAVKWAYT